MTFSKISNLVAVATAVPMLLALTQPSHAQGPVPDAPSSSIEAPARFVTPPAQAEVPHKFWDNENRLLFAGVAATSAADFAITHANLQNGGRELNPVVRIFGRSTPALALNFAGETVAVISLGYFFHKTNHHRLERLTSIVNMGATMGAVSFGLAHR